MTETTDPVAAEHEANMMMFRVVHETATGHAGRPVPEIMAELARRLPRVPGLAQAEIRRIAEEISVGRDPSGL